MKVVVNGTTDQANKAAGPADGVRPQRDRLQGRAASCSPPASSTPFVQNSNNSAKWNVAWSAWYQDYPTQADFPERPAGLRYHPQGQRRQPEHRGVLRQEGPGADRQGPDPREHRPGRGRRSSGRRSITRTPTWRRGSTCTTPSRSTSSPRNVHGYSWNPQWYILIDQLWLS